jgi:hypothetical protein
MQGMSPLRVQMGDCDWGRVSTVNLGPGPDYATMAALVAVAGAVVYQLVGQVLEVRGPAQAARGIHPHSIAVLPLDNSRAIRTRNTSSPACTTH